MTMTLIDMLLAKLGLARTYWANRWAYQASCYRCKLIELHHNTPHETIKKEIEDVLHQAETGYDD